MQARWPRRTHLFLTVLLVLMLLLLLLTSVLLPRHGVIDKGSRLTGSITRVSSFPIWSIIKDFIPGITRQAATLGRQSHLSLWKKYNSVNISKNALNTPAEVIIMQNRYQNDFFFPVPALSASQMASCDLWLVLRRALWAPFITKSITIFLS